MQIQSRFLVFFPHLPFLHLAIRIAAVIDEAGLVAHAIAVDHHPAIEVEAVVIAVVVVLLDHPVPGESRGENSELRGRRVLRPVLPEEQSRPSVVGAAQGATSSTEPLT